MVSYGLKAERMNGGAEGWKWSLVGHEICYDASGLEEGPTKLTVRVIQQSGVVLFFFLFFPFFFSFSFPACGVGPRGY